MKAIHFIYLIALLLYACRQEESLLLPEFSAHENNPVLTPDGEGFDAFTVGPGIVVKVDSLWVMYFNWTKFNDPSAAAHPFAESDPVLMPGNQSEWDGIFIWMANVTRLSVGFIMYYTGIQKVPGNEIKMVCAIGYATSKDGIHWVKCDRNPVFQAMNDPYLTRIGDKSGVENPATLFLDSVCYMYYDCPNWEGGIGVATAQYPVGGLSRGAQ